MELYFAEHDVGPGSRSRQTTGLAPAMEARLALAAFMASSAELVTDADPASDHTGQRYPQSLARRAEELLRSVLEHDPSVQGVPPASPEAIEALETHYVSPHDTQRPSGLGGAGKNEDDMPSCAICTEEFEAGEPAARMPCGHFFHRECLVPWLKAHCSCPTCRHEIPSTSPEYDEQKKVQRRQGAVSSLMEGLYN